MPIWLIAMLISIISYLIGIVVGWFIRTHRK